MNLEIFKKLNNATLTKEEFNLLPFLDREDYVETAKIRFSKLDSHIDKKHIDWKIRIQANNNLSLLLRKYIEKNLQKFNKSKKINLIELGSSLGAITTLFALREIDKAGLLSKVDIWLLDIYKRGLDETKKLKFNIDLILKDGKFGNKFDKNLLKEKLKSASIIKADIIKLPKNLPRFDIILSGFTHHHLNIADKKTACFEMEKIAKKNAFIGVGDLFFDYQQFIKWLKKHKNEKNTKREKIPYAIESFIPIRKHIAFFNKIHFQFKVIKKYYYCFYLTKK
ncbi:MAG: class I SAM-dependent methyltransferase [Patescibacteria group bacterium]